MWPSNVTLDGVRLKPQASASASSFETECARRNRGPLTAARGAVGRSPDTNSTSLPGTWPADLIPLGKAILDATVATCIALALLVGIVLAGVQIERALSEPYAPTRANPTVAGVDATGEG